MTDIEIKRKELETAKMIRENGYYCGGLPGCKEMECPADPTKDRQDHCGVIYGKWGVQEWDDFIATREAELAELDKKAPTNAYCTCMTSSESASDQMQGCNHSMPSTGSTNVWKPSPTVDDFALALIQGMGESAIIHHPGTLYDLAEAYKTESDRRRS